MSNSYRLIINNDGWEPFRRDPAPITPETILRSVDDLAHSQVDTLCWSVGDDTVTYPTRKADMVADDPDLEVRIIHDWLAQGIDHNELVIERAHSYGIEVFLSVRMNDCHHKTSAHESIGGKFWREHQQYRLWDVTEGCCYYNASLDYSHAEVRQRRFDVITEIAELYDADGIELDMMRNPFFFYRHEAEEKKGILTGFLREVRAALDEIARAKGREKIALMIHCPLQPQLLKERGMDVEAWMREKLADVFAMPGDAYNDYRAVLEPWADIAAAAGVIFRPGLESGTVHNGMKNRSGRENGTLHGIPPHNHINPCTPEELMGMAQNFLAQGAEGLYLYNYPCLLTEHQREGRGRKLKEYLDVLKVSGQRETLRGRNKTYVFNDGLPLELEVHRPPQYYQTAHFVVREPEIEKDGGHWLINFRLTGFPDLENVHFLLNGERLERRHIDFSVSKKIDCGRSGYTIEAHRHMTLKPPAGLVRNGCNSLAFFLERGQIDEHSGIEVYELEVQSVYGA